MSRVDVVRAWRDPQYRRSLSREQRAALPRNPAGEVQVSEQELQAASGAGPETGVQTTAWFCTLYTFLARCC
jgi:mersacidin/lichenicidin family type 2 lantibiotic